MNHSMTIPFHIIETLIKKNIRKNYIMPKEKHRNTSYIISEKGLNIYESIESNTNVQRSINAFIRRYTKLFTEKSSTNERKRN